MDLAFLDRLLLGEAHWPEKMGYDVMKDGGAAVGLSKAGLRGRGGKDSIDACSPFKFM